MSSLRRSFFDPSTLEPLYEGMHCSNDGIPSIAKTFNDGAAGEKTHTHEQKDRLTDRQRGGEG